MDVDTLKLMTREMAEILRDAIRKSGLSGVQLAADTGVKQQTVSDFLRGKDIRLKTAHKLAERLGLALKRER